MRVVIDAMCAEYGGIRTYVEHLLGTWAGLYPDDEVHVVLRRGSSIPTPHLHRHEVATLRPDVLGRPLAQATAMHRIVRDVKPDCVLATAPTTDVRRLSSTLAVVILDLRAELRPEQFSLFRRLLRRLSYGRTFRLANGFISISQRSLTDLHDLHPSTRSKPSWVAHLGADHVLAWPAPDRRGGALGFAHHSNKNPTLLLDAWDLLRGEGRTVPKLTIVGVGSTLRADLEAVIAAHDLQELVTLAPFLPDDEFHALFAASELIVFPSDFEGFGLPVVEAMVLEKPVIIGPDPGTLEVAGGHATVMTGWNPEGLADAVQEAMAMRAGQLEAAREWASSFTWDRTVRATRDALGDIHRCRQEVAR